MWSDCVKRRILKLTLFLLAGAIINVAVAEVLSTGGTARPQGTFHVIFTWKGALTMRGENIGLPFGVIHRRWGEEATSIIWPGLAINTIFYAAILWMIFAAPGAVRRWRRIKRGQCASCGYSLRGTSHVEKCPECGATG